MRFKNKFEKMMIVVFVLTAFIVTSANGQPAKPNITDTTNKATPAGYYTCTMHPQIHEAKPGNCPICGMKLVYKNPGEPSGKTKGMGGCMMMK